MESTCKHNLQAQVVSDEQSNMNALKPRTTLQSYFGALLYLHTPADFHSLTGPAKSLIHVEADWQSRVIFAGKYEITAALKWQQFFDLSMKVVSWQSRW